MAVEWLTDLPPNPQLSRDVNRRHHVTSRTYVTGSHLSLLGALGAGELWPFAAWDCVWSVSSVGNERCLVWLHPCLGGRRQCWTLVDPGLTVTWPSGARSRALAVICNVLTPVWASHSPGCRECSSLHIRTHLQLVLPVAA